MALFSSLCSMINICNNFFSSAKPKSYRELHGITMTEITSGFIPFSKSIYKFEENIWTGVHNNITRFHDEYKLKVKEKCTHEVSLLDIYSTHSTTYRILECGFYTQGSKIIGNTYTCPKSHQCVIALYYDNRQWKSTFKSKLITEDYTKNQTKEKWISRTINHQHKFHVSFIYEGQVSVWFNQITHYRKSQEQDHLHHPMFRVPIAYRTHHHFFPIDLNTTLPNGVLGLKKWD